jgi:hydroxymethylpyrimidine pyrophosphatase-like HAD family hydrolase
MNIGIVKLWFDLPGKNSQLKQSTSWPHETWEFAKQLKDLYHDVFIVSGVDGQSYLPEWNKEKLDFLFVFNGKNILNPDDSVEKLAIFQKNVDAYIDFCKCLKEKTKIVYVGNERDKNRTKKLLKYYDQYAGKLVIYGKWKDKKITKLDTFMGPIDFKDSAKVLNNYRYSLVITDKKYENNNFITPRFYECITAGCVPVVDKDYDKKDRLNVFLKINADSDFLNFKFKDWLRLIRGSQYSVKTRYTLSNRLIRFFKELK